MSKVALRNGPSSQPRAGQGGTSFPTRYTAALSADAAIPRQETAANHSTDICPVCSSGGYLDPDLRFYLNPDCYHKMCQKCVQRIFRNGPALCPYQGCNRTLRMNRFREITFEDIRVEKEVDVRRRMSRIFNKREEDFETMHDYNNYLNKVEDIIFDLINGVNVEQRNREVAEYQQSESDSIAENAGLAVQESQSFQAQQEYEKEQARLRRDAAVKEDEMEKRDRLEGRMDYINKLATSNSDARKIAGESQRARLAKAQVRKSGVDAHSAGSGGGFTFAGLKQKTAPEPEKPYDPFAGYSMEKQYFVLQDNYTSPWLDAAEDKPEISAGGYSMTEWCSRALSDAFAGLAVFVGDELREKDKASAPATATQTAAAAADDVF